MVEQRGRDMTNGRARQPLADVAHRVDHQKKCIRVEWNGPDLAALDDTAAKHTIPLVKHCRLSGAQRSLGLVKLNL